MPRGAQHRGEDAHARAWAHARKARKQDLEGFLVINAQFITCPAARSVEVTLRAGARAARCRTCKFLPGDGMSQTLNCPSKARSVEVTLRAGAGARARGALQDLEVGQLVRGRVKRVERYGVFVEARRPAALPNP